MASRKNIKKRSHQHQKIMMLPLLLMDWKLLIRLRAPVYTLGDYLYYKVVVNKKALFYEYKGSDYYRTKVLKIYSKKRNNFRKVPLFVVNYQGVCHVLFEADFQKHWLTEDGFRAVENKNIRNTLIAGLLL